MRKIKISFFILCILLVIIIVKQSIFLDFSAKEKESETLYVSTTNEISVLDLDTEDPPIEIYRFWSDKNTIVTKQSECVTFMAEIFANVTIQEQEVLVCSEQGIVLGSMNDNGLQGDTIAGDGIYTLQKELYAEEVAQETYVAVVRQVISQPVFICYYEAFVSEELERIQKADEALQQLLTDITYQSISEEEKRQKIDTLLKQLENNNLILKNSIRYDSVHQLYTFQYGCGVQGGISLREQELDTYNGNVEQAISYFPMCEAFSRDREMFILNRDKKIHLISSKTNYIYEEVTKQNPNVRFTEANLAKRILYSSKDNNQVSQTNSQTTKQQEEKKVLIFNGFENTSYRREFYENLKKEWDTIGLYTEIDYSVSVADLKSLQDMSYKVIVFALHGTHYTIEDGKETVPVLCLDEIVNSSKDEAYAYELKTSKTVARVRTNQGIQYWVLPTFFSDTNTKQNLGGKVIFSESCMFYGCDCQNSSPDTIFADVFIKQSAEAVIGYYNAVDADYSRNIMKMTMEQTYEGKTLQEALNIAKTKYGAKDNRQKEAEDKYPAYPVLTGNGNYILGNAGKMQGNVLDASNNQSIEKALVRIYQNGTCIASTRTGTRGEYTIEGLNVGTYIVKITAGSYRSIRIEVNIKSNRVTYMTSTLLLKVTQWKTGFVHGIVFNAVTAEQVMLVDIRVRKNWNNKVGEIIYQTSTNENGYYSIEYAPGFYTLELVKEGFITEYKNIVIGAILFTEQDMTIIPIGEENVYRIVLTWGENPSDLDAHMVGTLSNEDAFHVYYENPVQQDASVIRCSLDIDDRTSYGPETITLYPEAEKEYHYYVQYYAGVGDFSESYAKVNIYKENHLLETILISIEQKTGTYWYVFTIKGDQIVVHNKIT